MERDKLGVLGKMGESVCTSLNHDFFKKEGFHLCK